MTFDELERNLRTRDDVVFGTGIDEASVAEAERALGSTFPSELREYLKRFGHLELGHYELFGLGSDIPDYLDLVKMARTERTEAGSPVRNDLVPLLNDGGGNLHCIGTSGDALGKIFVWEHEEGPEQEPEERAESMIDWVVELLADLDE